WNSLLTHWARVEEVMGFLDSCAKNYRLSTTERPDEVSAWLRGRRKIGSIPQFDDITEFATQWRKWWTHLQPAVRVPSTSVGWPLLRPTSGDIDWSRLRYGGRNGLFVVVLTLLWW
ncbi:hypothetical protein BD410DRAFT_696249, partial [Rickenella mellea]